MPHLLATVTAHGLGHLAQTAPVLNTLRRKLPGLRLTVASTIDESRLRQRIEGDFHVEARALDVGFVMEDAFRVARAPSALAYQAAHADWESRVDDTVRWLERDKPDLLLCNAAYLPLAAAQRLGIAAFGMSSLNWADLFAYTFGNEPWAPPIHAQMLQSYRSARAFIKLRPGMDMPDLANGRWAGPVARLGRPRRAEMMARLRAGSGERVALVAFGGVHMRLPMETWDLGDGLRWLVPQSWGFVHPAVHAIESLGLDFSDLIASVDVVLGKPGYGTFVEAVCNGTPMLYARRSQWPEQEPLIEWLHAHGRAQQVEDGALRSGALRPALDALWRQPKPEPVLATGSEEVAGWLAAEGLSMR